jgi:ribonuclease HII
MLKPYKNFNCLECGIDEVGAGCLAGPVTIAAVIWPQSFDENLRENLLMIKDSKKLSEKNRYLMRDFILEHAIDVSIIDIDNTEIDRINILQARLKGFHQAIDELSMIPDHILVDGTQFKLYTTRNGTIITHDTIMNGDNIYQSIAAASIIAKCHRDDYMKLIHIEYPIYKWEKNKGYGTKEHRDSIIINGISKYHRKTFGTCKEAINN